MGLDLPRGWEWLGVPMGMLTALWLGIPAVFIALLGLQALDLLTGVLAAIKKGEAISPVIFRNGLIERGLDWCMIFSVSMLGWIAPDQIPQLGLLPSTGLAMAFAVHEALSIADNRNKAGGWLPAPVKKVLAPDAPFLESMRPSESPNGKTTETSFVFPADTARRDN